MATKPKNKVIERAFKQGFKSGGMIGDISGGTPANVSVKSSGGGGGGSSSKPMVYATYQEQPKSDPTGGTQIVVYADKSNGSSDVIDSTPQNINAVSQRRTEAVTQKAQAQQSEKLTASETALVLGYAQQTVKASPQFEALRASTLAEAKKQLTKEEMVKAVVAGGRFEISGTVTPIISNRKISDTLVTVQQYPQEYSYTRPPIKETISIPAPQPLNDILNPPQTKEPSLLIGTQDGLISSNKDRMSYYNNGRPTIKPEYERITINPLNPFAFYGIGSQSDKIGRNLALSSEQAYYTETPQAPIRSAIAIGTTKTIETAYLLTPFGIAGNIKQYGFIETAKAYNPVNVIKAAYEGNLLKATTESGRLAELTGIILGAKAGTEVTKVTTKPIFEPVSNKYQYIKNVYKANQLREFSTRLDVEKKTPYILTEISKEQEIKIKDATESAKIKESEPPKDAKVSRQTKFNPPIDEYIDLDKGTYIKFYPKYSRSRAPTVAQKPAKIAEVQTGISTVDEMPEVYRIALERVTGKNYGSGVKKIGATPKQTPINDIQLRFTFAEREKISPRELKAEWERSLDYSIIDKANKRTPFSYLMPQGKKAQIQIFKEKPILEEPQTLKQKANTFQSLPKLPELTGGLSLFPPRLGGETRIKPYLGIDIDISSDNKEDSRRLYTLRNVSIYETPLKVRPNKPLIDQIPDTRIKPFTDVPIIPKEKPPQQKIIPVTIPIFDYDNIYDLRLKEIPKPIPPEEPQETKRDILPPTITKNTGGRDYQGYNVYVKEGGQYTRVNRKPLPKNKALNLGAEITDNTLSQQFKLARSKRTRIKDDTGFYLGNKFSYSQGTYKEKKGYAIDSLGEVQGINAKRYLRGYKSVNLF